jgi:hypothetical protein
MHATVTKLRRKPWDERPWLFALLPVPALVALATILLRVMLHYGVWDAVPMFFVVLLLAGFAALIASGFAAQHAPRRWRFAAFFAWLGAQAALSWGLMHRLDAILPFRIAGP